MPTRAPFRWVPGVRCQGRHFANATLRVPITIPERWQWSTPWAPYACHRIRALLTPETPPPFLLAVRCQMSGVRCQVSGVRCQVSGVRCQGRHFANATLRVPITIPERWQWSTPWAPYACHRIRALLTPETPPPRLADTHKLTSATDGDDVPSRLFRSFLICLVTLKRNQEHGEQDR